VGRSEAALNALDVIKAAGLRCPEDIELFCQTDDAAFETTEPTVTVYRMPNSTLASEATRLLIKVLEHPDLPTTWVEVPWRYVERESCRVPELRDHPPAVTEHVIGGEARSHAN
jgi:LacI family transcriptional regulator